MGNYQETVGFVAMLVTMVQMLAGTVICKDIYKQGTAKGVDPIPFIGGVALCILMLRYALILNDETMINVNIFGIITNVLYMLVYYYYAPNKGKISKQIGKTTVGVLIFLVYAEMESEANLEYRFGILITVLFLLLIAAPLVHIEQIIKTKNADILPIPLIIMGTLVSFMWLWYGYIISNSFVINAVGLVLNMIQLSLFAIYDSKKSQHKTGKQDKKD